MPFSLTPDARQEIERHFRKQALSWSEDFFLPFIAPPGKKMDVYWATIALRSCGSLRSVEALKSLASYPVRDIQACAMLTIAQIAGAAETPYYAECLLDGAYRGHKVYPLWAIGVAGDARALPAVEQYIRKHRTKLSAASADTRAQLEALVFLVRHSAQHPQAKTLLTEYSFLAHALRRLHPKSRSLLLQREPALKWILQNASD